MLRSLRDRLLVSLEPEAVSWVRLSGVFRPRIVAKASTPVDVASTEEPWAAAAAALQHEAGQWRAHRLAVTVVLSNHFVRYAIIPPLDQGTSGEEALALARYRFTKIHGERAAAWHVRLASSLTNGPRLASAIDSALLESLKSCFPKEGKARLRSVQPYLMSAFNFWRHKIGKQGAWLLLVEPETICLAMLAGRDWTAVQNVRRSAAAADWLTLLEREKQRIDVERVPDVVLTRSSVPAAFAECDGPGWRFVMLHPPAFQGALPHEAERYALALHAI